MLIRGTYVSVLLAALIALGGCGKDKTENSGEQATIQPSNLRPTTQAQASSSTPPATSDTTAPSPAMSPPGGDAISLAGVTFTIPEGWVQETPDSTMRLAQYRLPGEAGPAELTVFHFGPGQGGSTQANIDRWVGQFQSPETPNNPPESDVSAVDHGPLKLSIVKASGTYTPTPMGPMAPRESPKTDFALYGLIVEGGPRGTLFIKATGPQSTIQAQEQALESFARSATLAM